MWNLLFKELFDDNGIFRLIFCEKVFISYAFFEYHSVVNAIKACWNEIIRNIDHSVALVLV